MGVGHAGHSDAARSRGLLSVSRCRFAARVWPVRRVGSVDSAREPGLSGPANWLQVGGLRRRGAHAACATRGQDTAKVTGTGPTSSDSWAYRSRAAGASAPVPRSRRRRQNRPAASSQAEGKCEIANVPQCSVYPTLYRPAPGSSRMHISSTNNPPGPGPRGTPVPFYSPSRSRSLGGHKTTKLAKVLS